MASAMGLRSGASSPSKALHSPRAVAARTIASKVHSRGFHDNGRPAPRGQGATRTATAPKRSRTRSARLQDRPAAAICVPSSCRPCTKVSNKMTRPVPVAMPGQAASRGLMPQKLRSNNTASTACVAACMRLTRPHGNVAGRSADGAVATAWRMRIHARAPLAAAIRTGTLKDGLRLRARAGARRVPSGG